MYRIFCESYQNYIKSFDEENYRLKIRGDVYENTRCNAQRI